MIGVVAAVIGGLIVGLKTPLFSPVVYLSSKLRKDLFLIMSFVYCLALGYEIVVTNIYNINPIIIFAVVLPSILLLDTGLKNEREDAVCYILTVLMVIGLLIRYVFIIAIIIALLYYFSKDNPKRGIFIVLISISILMLGLFLCRSLLNLLGATSSQVVYIAAISIIIVLLFWRKIEKLSFVF